MKNKGGNPAWVKGMESPNKRGRGEKKEGTGDPFALLGHYQWVLDNSGVPTDNALRKQLRLRLVKEPTKFVDQYLALSKQFEKMRPGVAISEAGAVPTVGGFVTVEEGAEAEEKVLDLIDDLLGGWGEVRAFIESRVKEKVEQKGK